MVRSNSLSRLFVVGAVLVAILVSSSEAQRTAYDKEDTRQFSASPSPYCLALHSIGQLLIPITNYGKFGIGRDIGGASKDCFTGLKAPMGEYPKGANATYLYKGALWVGGIRGSDTLVSTGNEFNNESQEFHPLVEMTRSSSLGHDDATTIGAVSEQDFIAVYVDTFVQGVPNATFDALEGRRHKPLGLRITQKSYAWSYGHTDDFIIVEYEIVNIGKFLLRDVYLGIYWDGDVHLGQKNVNIPPDPFGGKGTTDGRDDLSGYVFRWPTPRTGCFYQDTVVLAWTADNDGDVLGTEIRVPHVAGIRFLNQIIKPNRKISFNWWTFNNSARNDFGPQKRQSYRYMGNGSGTPYGDRRKYHLLSNGEIDYDQMRTLEIGEFDQVWMYPTFNIAASYARGVDVQYLLSIGPYNIAPGASIVFPIAIVAGKDFHKDYVNFNANNRGKYDAELFYDNLGFGNLMQNAVTADKVYDVPGLDTDGDGYRGAYHVCDEDTVYYKGDGIPDLIASEPPPAPEFWIRPIANGFRIRFNGALSENTPDIFSGKMDFEGYRVYLALDDREGSYSLVAQYDRQNYDKWVYVTVRGKTPQWRRFDDPFTLEELRCLYAFGSDSCNDTRFDPLFFLPDRPYEHPEFPDDSLFYFVKHEYNAWEYGISTPIRRIYPDQAVPSSLTEPNEDELTDDGYLKYYEYEFEIHNLLPNLSYHVVITAFDFGSPETELEPLESSKVLFAKTAYPNNEWDEKTDGVGNVYVYPNPYRSDGGYRMQGYEGRGQEHRIRDRVRKVTFGNLPAKCSISIFTLDGDLVKRIDHDFSPSDPNSSYQEWDLINRNIQLVVSGLYYWSVEDDQGNVQVGKLVLLF